MKNLLFFLLISFSVSAIAAYDGGRITMNLNGTWQFDQTVNAFPPSKFTRSNPNIAGVLAFCYLANNYGYTGDWFAGNIKDLKPTATLEWFQHAFAPAGTFINLTDERYVRMKEPHVPGSTLLFNLAGINNNAATASGTVKIKLIDSKGKSVSEQMSIVKLPSWLRTNIPVSITLPSQTGGYLLLAEFTPEKGQPVISRRFIKVGKQADYSYFFLNPITK